MEHVSGPYAAWATWLAAFGRGEDLPGDHLVPVDDQLGPHMTGRILKRLNEVFVARQELWVRAFVRDQEVTPLTPLTLATVLVQARTRLRPLVRLTRDELFPQAVRDALRETLTEVVSASQRGIEDSVRRHSLSGDVLLSVVRDNALTAAVHETFVVDTPVGPAPGRTVIL